MSNWITEEANKNNVREHEDERRRRLIQASNYWAAIVRQIEADVNAVNDHPYWKHRLSMVGFPLQFRSDPLGNGYQISKSGFPAVLVTFTNVDEGIEITREFTENPVAGQFKDETLTLKAGGDHVVLITQDNQSLMVPEDVSRYIMKAVIESAKFTKPV